MKNPDIHRRVFCAGRCFKTKTFTVVRESDGWGSCPTCGWSRFLPMGLCAQVARIDQADQLKDHTPEE